MEDEVIGAEGERALDFLAKAGDAFGAHLFGLAAEVDEIAGVNHERRDVMRGPQFAQAGSLLGVHRRGRHMRGLDENIWKVLAPTARARRSGVGGAARGAQVHANALDHEMSVMGVCPGSSALVRANRDLAKKKRKFGASTAPQGI